MIFVLLVWIVPLLLGTAIAPRKNWSPLRGAAVGLVGSYLGVLLLACIPPQELER